MHTCNRADEYQAALMKLTCCMVHAAEKVVSEPRWQRQAQQS